MGTHLSLGFFKLMVPFGRCIFLSKGTSPALQSYGSKESPHMTPDFQPECSTMKDNLARRPVEFPPQRLHLVMVPGDIQRFQHKEPTTIIR